MTPIRPVTVIENRRKYVLHLLIIAVLWAAAMTMDYHDQAATERERAERIDKEFTACLRGEWRALTEQGVQLGCMPVEKNESRKRT